MSRLYALVFGLPLLAFLGGCSPSVDDYRYVPHPALAQIPATQPSQPPPVSAFVTVIGVRREDRDERIPASVEVRMRLENHGPQTVTFDPQTLDLSDGQLMKFLPPLASPAEPVTLAPMDTVTVNALLPFPPGHSHANSDMSLLQLRWRLQVGDGTVVQVVDFRRAYRVYYEPYPYPYYYPYGGWYGGWYGGVIVRHR